MGKALDEKKFLLDVINLHDFGLGDRKSIDDEPFGGGPGMVIRPDIVEKALNSIKSDNSINSIKYTRKLEENAMGAVLLSFGGSLCPFGALFGDLG